MNTLQLQAKYIEYVENFQKFHKSPLTFSEWQKWAEDRKPKAWPVVRFSTATNAYVTFHIPADNEGIARRLSDEWLKRYEEKHYTQNDGSGRQLSATQQKRRAQDLKQKQANQLEKDKKRIATAIATGKIDISVLLAALQQA